jgi:CheY-like chemotaxis protein
VLNLDPKLDQALAPHLDRVLIVDHMSSSARMLIDLLHNIHRGQVWTAATTAQGVGMAQTADPQIIFVEYSGPDLDGLVFTKALRRSHLNCRKAPVIMVTAQATPGAILGARDAGVHEFLRKPYTNKDLVRRLEAAAIRPRGWVEGVGYIGPDRRRFNSAEYRGARKRRTDTAYDSSEARAIQALRIVASAIGAVDTDPQQAFRALNAQATDLMSAASASKDAALLEAASQLQRHLGQVRSADRLGRAALEPYVNRLMTFLPKDEPHKARPAA